MEMPAVIEQIKNPREWTREDSLRQALSSGLILFDVAQTHGMNKNGNGTMRERNPFLGQRPSREKINKMAALGFLANLLLPRMLPPKPRRFMQNVVIGGELGAISGNHNIGLRAEF